MYQRMRLIPIYTVVVLDSMIMILMFNLANLLRFHQLHVVADNTNYMDMMLLILLSFLFTALVLHMNDNLLQRGKLDEFYVLAKQYIYVGFIVLFYLYLIKAGHYYSRIQLGYFFLLFDINDSLFIERLGPSDDKTGEPILFEVILVTDK